MGRTPLIALLPGALTLYLGLSGGGYFPPATAVGCAVLAIALVLRLTLAERPLEGFGLPVALAGAALALFAVWTLASSAWSDAPARAIMEFDRALLYLLAFALVATLPRTRETARWLLLGLGGAGTALCVAGLATRVLPEVFTVEATVLPQRLSYPISYWNGMGLMAALAIVVAVHLSASVREHLALRVAGAAALPLLAATLYFTFSRASIVVAIVAICAYALLARPRGLPAAFAAGLPAIAAVKFAYDADLLAKSDLTAPAAVDQGEEVAIVLIVCVVVAAALRLLLARLGADRRLDEVEIAPRARRNAALVASGVAAVLAVGAWFALDLGDRIDRQYERFKEGDVLGRPDDARDRLTETANNGRLDHWGEALDAWGTDRLKGTGAGTYELTWAQNRPSEFTVRDGHSLYLETLSEVGLVGGVLLMLALGSMLVVLVMRARGPDRALWAALAVTAGAWALHAAQDWVWELPSVTLWTLAVGAAALAHPGGSWRLPRIGRVVACLFVLVLTVTPVMAGVAHVRLQDSVSAFKRGDCDRAIDHGLAASSALSARPEPYAILGFCDIRLGKLDLAERMMQNAVDRDPENWVYHYGLALVLAADGRDPREEIASARRLNPLEAIAIRAERAFADDDPQTWRRRAREARLPIN